MLDPTRFDHPSELPTVASALWDDLQDLLPNPSILTAKGQVWTALSAALPGVRIAVDKWHLVALAKQMVTEVRQRLTRERLGRCGTTAERVWTHRQLLLTGYQHLSTKQVARLQATLANNAAADSHMDETTRLARTIETWWPAIRQR